MKNSSILKGVKKLINLFKEAFSEFISDNVLKLSAALSYYTVFSLAPLLIIITSVCSLWLGPKAIQGELNGQIKNLVGDKAASQIQDMVANTSLTSNSAFVAIVGGIILVIGASGIFAEIQDSINYIWGIKSKPNLGLKRFLKNRIMSFSMIGSLGFLLLVSLLFSSAMELMNKRLLIYLHSETAYIYYLLNIVVVFILTTLLFLVIFKILPDGKISFKDCFLGASFTAILFMLGKFLIGAYLGSSAMTTVYGSAGSLAIILAWVYYSAIILYFGAEFTKVYSKTYGKNIIPDKYTVLIPKSEGNL